MCTIPAAPLPPPPPPMPVILDQSTIIRPPAPDTQNAITYCSDVCVWASEYRQLWEVCIKYNLCLKEPPFRFKYNHIESIQQVGPTCGMAALSMLLKGNVSAAEILDIAKQEGYSNNGEMFSCKQMSRLAQKVINSMNLNNAKTVVKTGGLFSDEIIDKLLDGAMLLVPYDADCNHSPCLRNGHTAHWALICGVIVIKDTEDQDSHNTNVYVLSRHGKSRYLVAWSLKELSKSNKNLWEFSPKRGVDGLTYVLPEEGIGGKNGLRGQFLLFEGL